MAEHVSPPLSEEIKITLKVSQNLHAGMGLYFLGLFVAKNTKDPLFAGFKVERGFLTDAKLDISGASQGDGAGGDRADLFSPDFMCQYLAYWKTRPDFPILFNGLPILGKDGTLAKIQKDNPGAGQVFAKTGTFAAEDKLNSRLMLNGKGLAGLRADEIGQDAGLRGLCESRFDARGPGERAEDRGAGAGRNRSGSIRRAATLSCAGHVAAF